MDLSNLTQSQLAKFCKYKISEMEKSDRYKAMQKGRDYYDGKHEVDSKMRQAIGPNGRLVEITNVPNCRYKNNQYAKLVDQKVNYMVTKPPNISANDEKYQELVSDYMDLRFVRTLNYITIDMLNCGIGWMYLYTDGEELKYTRMDPLEIFPVWQDKSKESLSGLIRKWSKSFWVPESEKIAQKDYVTLYLPTRLVTWRMEEDKYVLESEDFYMRKNDELYSWTDEKIPFVYFRFNQNETTLLERVQKLQDGINLILSAFGDKVLEDPRNTILVLKGYEGENLGEFRYQLAQYGAVKVASDNDAGGQGGVDKLDIVVDSTNFETILRILKEAMIENGRGIDSRLERMGQSPNQMNIESMYADIELDANRIELEVQASFEHLLRFFNDVHGLTEQPVTITFKRNMMVNRESVVDMINSSRDILPTKIMLDNHPLVEDSAKAMDMLAAEKEERMEEFRMQSIRTEAFDFTEDE